MENCLQCTVLEVDWVQRVLARIGQNLGGGEGGWGISIMVELGRC
jgi:hypothetical protein